MPAPELLVDGPDAATLTLILAHGAGAGMDSPFMAHIAEGIAARGIRVVRFEFPYMAARRRRGGRRPPDRLPVLIDSWRAALASAGGTRPAIGGKSLGGRAASMIADDCGARALVCLGYPFHPAGRPQRTRTDHLAGLRTPTLICQGTRDALGARDEVAGYHLSPAISIAWIEDGDHSFRPRAASGRTERENLDAAAEAAATFLLGGAGA